MSLLPNIFQATKWRVIGDEKDSKREKSFFCPYKCVHTGVNHNEKAVAIHT